LTISTPGSCFNVAMSGCAMVYDVSLGWQFPARYTDSKPLAYSTLRYPENPFRKATNPRACSSMLGPMKYSSSAAAMMFAELPICRWTTSLKGGMREPDGRVLVK
jgi:hypothetical protein